MTFDPKKIRIMFAGAACLLFLIIAGLYYQGQKKENGKINIAPSKLPFNVQQAANGFNYTKSDGDKKQFTISAGKVVQLKNSQRQAFSDVRIIMYSPNADKGGYDQIWGKEFDYDPKTGDVKGRGEVSIVLAAQGSPSQDPEQVGKGTMRLTANGLSFNQKSGLAQTAQDVNFELVQGKGSAVGAEYDSRAHTLTLHSNVRMVASARPAVNNKPNFQGTVITAAGAIITDNPREAIFTDVIVEQGERKAQAHHATMQLRADNTMDRISANGELRLHAGGKSTAEVVSEQGELRFGIYSELLSAVMDGGIRMSVNGMHSMNASSKHAEIDFGAGDKILQMRCSGGVKIEQLSVKNGKTAPGASNQPMQMEADAIDFKFSGNNEIENAVTHGAAKLTTTGSSTSGAAASERSAGTTMTVLTADKFTAVFASHNTLKTLTGTGNAKSVTTSAGKPDRSSSSHELVVTFDPARNGAINKVDQTGDFRYLEGPRNTSAASGHYSAADETFLLSGTPRVEDTSTGMTLTADSIRLERISGNAHAIGNVKSSYRSVKNVASHEGALWSDTKEPVHATAAALDYDHATDTAVFSGGARLWQGSDAVQASTITFNRSNKSLQANGETGSTGTVQTSFLQTDKNGKTTPINVVSSSLKYSDDDRTAHFEGGVKAKTLDSTLTSKQVEVVLKPRKTVILPVTAASGKNGQSSQLESLTAQGSVQMDGTNPVRKGKGEKLVYTADDGKYVLTGTDSNLPSIFDAEKGQTTGDSLTFFSHDDRVQINGGEKGRVVTKTSVKSGKKP